MSMNRSKQNGLHFDSDTLWIRSRTPAFSVRPMIISASWHANNLELLELVPSRFITFSWRSCCRLRCSCILHRADWYIFPTDLKKRCAFIFRVQQYRIFILVIPVCVWYNRLIEISVLCKQLCIFYTNFCVSWLWFLYKPKHVVTF